MNRYPDMGSVELYDALARRLSVGTGQLAVGTGSVALLYHLVQAFCEPGDEVVYAWRSFEAYPIAVAVCGAVSVRVPVTETGEHDLGAMAEAITDRTKVVLVCTPNNPTGPAVSRGALTAFLDRVPEHVVVVVDEAYREFVRIDDPVDAVALAGARSNVVAMRTFAKAYGLAGLRCGYLAVVRLKTGAQATPEDIRAHVARLLPAYKVPVLVEIRDEELPRNASGKVLKTELRAQVKRPAP